MKTCTEHYHRRIVDLILEDRRIITVSNCDCSDIFGDSYLVGADSKETKDLVGKYARDVEKFRRAKQKKKEE